MGEGERGRERKRECLSKKIIVLHERCRTKKLLFSVSFFSGCPGIFEQWEERVAM